MQWAFAEIARLPAVVHPHPTNRPIREHRFGIGRLKATYRSLDTDQQRRSKYRIVIVIALTTSAPKHWGLTDKRSFKMTPEDPALSVIFTESIVDTPVVVRPDGSEMTLLLPKKYYTM